MQDLYTALHDIFGYDDFRPGQEQIVNQLLSGGDVLAVMPTGAGKSLCYQLPAVLLPGVTVVVSPLISLMKDQVQALLQMGVRAAYINSSLTENQCRLALRNAAAGMYKVVYAAPERLLTPAFLHFAQAAQVSLLCVDEAHCVSQWGQDFRPSYQHIRQFADLLPRPVPIGAFTATATARVKQDIRAMLALRNPLEVATGFDRPNLWFEVQQLRPKEKYPALTLYLETHPDTSGIVYCATRKTVDQVYTKLAADGYAAARYHAGMEPEERRCSQDAFVYDQVRVMVATNAFGMGIDKSNVGFVIHYNMPMDIESYYQEAGRAGRDGQPADCILLYSPGDVKTGQFLIESGEPQPGADPDIQEELKDAQRQRLKKMTFYCHSEKCLRSELLWYFGEHSPRQCGNCSVCRPEAQRAAVSILLARRELRRAAAEEANLDDKLLAGLKALRLALAKRAGVPAFVVFTDETLRDMCRKRPHSPEEMRAVSGVGAAKLQRYGQEFLAAIADYERSGSTR